MKRTIPALLGLGFVIALLGKLLDPRNTLITRDIPFFHLPLRTAFSSTFLDGIPWWNPAINGGQPILSNPSYSAFYPPSWLGLVVAPHYALNLQIVLHALIAFVGAWKLAERLGCRRPATLLAGIAFVGSGGYLSMLHAITLFFSLSWLPWLIYFAASMLEVRDGSSTRRWPEYACICAGILALQLLIGEPVTVIIGLVTLLALSTAGVGSRPREARRLLLPLALAIGLAGIQLVPTWYRVQDSPRADGISVQEALDWSTTPSRLVDMAYPRLFGNPSKQESYLYLGWKIHDRSFPYVLSIYPGIMILVLALCALGRWPTPLKRVWVIMAGIGVFLALGKYNPVYARFLVHIPPFSIIRYPEKFILLTTTALSFAGPLGWQHLLTQRQKKTRKIADFPIALGLVSCGVCGLLLGLAQVWPHLASWFVRTNSGVELTADQIALGAQHLSREMLITAGFSIAVTAIFFLHRLRRTDYRILHAGVVLFVALDLSYFGKDLLETGPSAQLLSAPPLAQEVRSDHFRVASVKQFDGSPAFVLPRTGQLPPILREGLDRLDPYAGNLWGISYFGNIDYDLMLTKWGQHAQRGLSLTRGNEALTQRYLGAWNVKFTVVPQPFKEQVQQRNLGTEDPPAGHLVENPFFLPRYRFAPKVTFHADQSTALTAARKHNFAVQTQDHWVDASLPAGSELKERSAPDTRLENLAQQSSKVSADYSATKPTYFVAAITFDKGWRATADDVAVKTFPTAIGQIGVELPPGEHHLELRYQDPAVAWGALLSIISMTGAIVLLAWQRRRPTTIGST